MKTEANASRVFSRIKELLKRAFSLKNELFFVSLGQILGFLGGFCGIKLLTYYMGPVGYGRLALGITISGLIHMFTFGQMIVVIARYFPVYQEKKALSVFFHLFWKGNWFLSFGILGVIVLAALLLSYFVADYWLRIMVIAGIFSIISGFNGTILTLQNSIRQRKIVAFHQALEAILRPIFTIFLLWMIQNSGEVALLGYALTALLVTLSQWYFLNRNGEFRENWNAITPPQEIIQAGLKEMLNYSYPFMVFAIFTCISSFSDRWFLQYSLGEKEVGIYSAIFQIANAPIGLLLGIINQFMVPIVFQRAGSGKRRHQVANSDRILRWNVFASLVLMFFSWLVAVFFGEEIIILLTSKAFAGNSNLLGTLVLGLFLLQIGNFISFKGFYTNQPKVYIPAKIVQAISFLVLAVLFGKAWGKLGVGMGLLGASLLHLMIIQFVNSRLKVSYEESDQA